MNKSEQLIACLEGEIAERDARIVELESDLAGTQSRVLSLQDQWRKLDAELAAIKAQEPAARQFQARDGSWHPFISEQHYQNTLANGWPIRALYAAPVSEAKAQGVVMPDRDAVIRKAVGMCNRIPGSTTWNAAEFAYDELAARLNATPVQQVSVPDGWKLVPVEPTLDMGWAYVDAANDASPGKRNSFNHFGYRAMLAAAPAPGGE